MQQLSELYRSITGEMPESVIPIAGAGSERQYFLIDGPKATVIGTVGVSEVENRAFIYMSGKFSEMGLPVPKVLAVSDDYMSYLQSVAGTQSLFDYLAPCRATGEYSGKEKALLEEVLSCLASFHTASCIDFDFSRCFPRGAMDARAIKWDLNYFKYSFLKPAGIDFDEEGLENDFDRLVRKIETCGMDSIILRDCQSRNIMLDEGGEHPVFIDFQGARRGCGLYDVVSFLWQARAAFPRELKWHLFNHYISSSPVLEAKKDELCRQLPLFILLRTLQVLGAYGFQGLIKKKELFVKSIPAAVDNVRGLLAYDRSDMPELRAVLERITMDKSLAKMEFQSGKLVVTVGSFSYRVGYPEDKSGNGGGFVFDCRALDNPGRYDEYKPLTGRDAPVIEFLETKPGVKEFLEAAWKMVDRSVAKYQERGFTSLSVFFGCTGGRHRSVYCAEQTARHIKDKFGVEIHLLHRERKISEVL